MFELLTLQAVEIVLIDTMTSDDQGLTFPKNTCTLVKKKKN